MRPEITPLPYTLVFPTPCHLTGASLLHLVNRFLENHPVNDSDNFLLLKEVLDGFANDAWTSSGPAADSSIDFSSAALILSRSLFFARKGRSSSEWRYQILRVFRIRILTES